MVLKKSNSPFNSGSTQKCIKGGSYVALWNPSDVSLSITLGGVPRIYDKHNPSTAHIKALDKIYDYLEFPGPELKQFYKSSYNIQTNPIMSDVLSFSLNKRELWLIPEKIDRLMKEINFLEDEEGFPEIRLHKFNRVADRKTFFRKESCVLNDTKVSKPAISKMEKRRETMKKPRGLQRPHLWTTARVENETNDWQEQSQKKYVELKLQEGDQIDSRVLGRRVGNRDNPWKNKIKPNRKSKGSVNGRYAYLYRTYSSKELKMETELVMLDYNETLEEDDYCYSDDNYDDDDDDDNDDTIEYYRKYQYHKRTIGDFLVLSSNSQIAKKGLEHKEEVLLDDTELGYINTAASQTTINHQKGSFQFVERPRSITGDIESETSFENDALFVDKNEVNDFVCPVNSNGVISDCQIANTEKMERQCVSNAFDTRNKFVRVRLKFTENDQERMFASLLESSLYSLPINDCQVLLGNCFPPVFCVDLNPTDSRSGSGWTLVGASSSDVFSHKVLNWEVNLKNTKSSLEGDKIRQMFYDNVSLIDRHVLQFCDLVQIALNSVQLSSHNQICKNLVLAVRYNEADVFSVLNNYDSFKPELYSMEGAINRLREVQINQTKMVSSSSDNTERQVKIPIECVECDICFNDYDKHSQNSTGIITLLPCSHSFCSECWQSHIFHQLKTGHTSIQCMHTDCQETLNETTMKVLIPERFLTKLFLQREERLIEASPLCQWCPSWKCNRIAMITAKTPRIEEFGCCVVCDCDSTWCFSCQANPHWPVSCRQAAAYKNLLYKLGDEMPSSSVRHTVNLKPCPGCKYPIEKNMGCPSMMCSRCNFLFCWKCLKSSRNHRVWECTADENSNFVSYELHNIVVNTFPLKFFKDAVDMRMKYKIITKNKVSAWLNGLSNVQCKKIKLSFKESLQPKEAKRMKITAINLASDSVFFIKDSYKFLEYFYLLFSFALLNKEKTNNQIMFCRMTQRELDRLAFTLSRLESLVVGRSLRQLVIAEDATKMFLSNGREMMIRLRNHSKLIQTVSKKVPAEPIGKLDPRKYYRYK